MKAKEYFCYYKNFFFFSLLIFLFGLFGGFLGAKFFPNRMLRVLTIVRVAWGEVTTKENWKQFLFVVLNRLFLFVLVPIFSVFFGIFPAMLLLSEGVIFGAFFFFLKDSLPLSLFLQIPACNILEIPVLILACALGFKVAKKTIDIVLSGESGLRKEMLLAFKFILKFLTPLLLLIAYIEIYLIPCIFNKLI